KFYKQASLMSLLINFVDLNFYREISASFGNLLDGKNAKYLIGNSNNGWGYGTYFNTSVIGAEVNFVNYLRLNQKLYTINLKYGFPFVNNGISLGAHQIFNEKQNFNMDLVLDLWHQEYYGNGLAFSTNNHFSINNKFDLTVQLGYKTEGYL